MSKLKFNNLKKQKTKIILISTLIILIFLLSQTGILFNPSSVVLADSTGVMLGDDGLLYSISTISLVNPIKVTYYMNGQNKKLDDGTSVIPVLLRSFTIEAESPMCYYQLKPEIVTIPGTDIEIYEKYILSPGVERKQIIRITDDTGNSVRGNVYENMITGSDYEFEKILKNYKGKKEGEVHISTSGTLKGAFDCPDGDYIVLKDRNDRPRVFNRAIYNNWVFVRLGVCADAGNLAQYVLFNSGACADAVNSVKYGEGIEQVNFATNIMSDMYFEPKNSPTKTSMIAVGKKGVFGNPIITFTADERYFDSKRLSAPIPEVEPVIVSISNNNPVERTQTSYLLIINNPSEYDKDFYVEIKAKYGSVSPSVTSIQANKNNDGKLTFFYTAPSVNQDTEETFTIQACDIGLNNINTKCVSKTFKRTIKDDDSAIIPLPREVCGDSICQSWNGENKQTCPQDCGSEPTPSPISCKEIPNSFYSNEVKECVCSVGFNTKYDINTGKMKCEKEQDIFGIIMIVLGAGIFAVVFYSMLINKKRRR